jgi:MoaA/NifB/PqqE/SkfB family radical SAM enzyme
MPIPTLHTVQFDLTDECPLFCRHCSNSSGPEVKSALQLCTVEAAIAEAIDLGCRTFIFSGGEPLRYSGLESLLAKISGAARETLVFTTGIRAKTARLPLSDAEWDGLKSCGLGTAVFSVYANPANREFQNRIVQLRPVGTIDAFQANEDAIRGARAAGISVEVQFVPSDETSSQLVQVADWTFSLGASRLHLQFPTRQGRNALQPSLTVTEGSESTLKTEALSLLLKEPTRFHISRLWAERWGLRDSSQQRSQAIVRSDGVVVRCNACKYLQKGDSKNLYEVSLQQIWKDESWHNASCECSNQQNDQLAVAGRERLHLMQANGLLASSAQRS